LLIFNTNPTTNVCIT